MASIPVPRQVAPLDDLTWQTIDICERLTSVALFALLGPVVVASAVAISLLSGRTPLIAHRRVGWRGSTLWMLKEHAHEDSSSFLFVVAGQKARSAVLTQLVPATPIRGVVPT